MDLSQREGEQNSGIPQGRTGQVGSQQPAPNPSGVCNQCLGWHNQGRHRCYGTPTSAQLIDICPVCGCRLGTEVGGTPWRLGSHVQACRGAYPEEWGAHDMRELAIRQAKIDTARKERQKQKGRRGQMAREGQGDEGGSDGDSGGGPGTATPGAHVIGRSQDPLELPELEIYTDGSCPDNERAQSNKTVPAGWGFVVWNRKGETIAERYGPVLTKYGPDMRPRPDTAQFAGAERGSNTRLNSRPCWRP